MSVNLQSIIVPERIKDLESEDKFEALNELVDLMATSKNVTDKEIVRKSILDREKIGSTGLGMGIAVPHVKIPQIRDFVIAIGRLRQPIDFQAGDGKPVELMIMIGASNKQSGEYLKLLAEVIKRCKNPDRFQAIMSAETSKEIAKLFAESA